MMGAKEPSEVFAQPIELAQVPLNRGAFVIDAALGIVLRRAASSIRRASATQVPAATYVRAVDQ
jgi:hypothetical protein